MTLVSYVDAGFARIVKALNVLSVRASGSVPFFTAAGVQKNLALNSDSSLPFITAASVTTSIKLVR